MAVSIQKRLMTSWQGVSSQQGFVWESSSPQLGWVHHLHLTFSTGHSYDLCQAKQSPAWSLVRFDILPFWFLGDPIWCHVFRYVWFGWRDFGHLWYQVKYDMIYCWHCLTQWRNLNLHSFLLGAMPLYHVVRQTKKPPNLSLYSLVHTSFSPCSLTLRCLLHIGACQKEQFFFTSCDMYDTHTDTLEVTASLFMKSFLYVFAIQWGRTCQCWGGQSHCGKVQRDGSGA